MAISGLSTVDTILLVANYVNAHNPKKHLDNEALKARGYTDDMIKTMRESEPQASHEEHAGIIFKGDFSNVTYPLFYYVMSLYRSFEKGVLPFEGSLSDQPGHIMDMFNLISVLEAERQNRELKEKEKNQKNGRR